MPEAFRDSDDEGQVGVSPTDGASSWLAFNLQVGVAHKQVGKRWDYKLISQTWLGRIGYVQDFSTKDSINLKATCKQAKHTKCVCWVEVVAKEGKSIVKWLATECSTDEYKQKGFDLKTSFGMKPRGIK